MKSFSQVKQSNLSYVLLFASQLIAMIQGQFPTVCMQNATLPQAVCCPVPEGFSDPCGGTARGVCQAIIIQNQTTLPRWSTLSAGLQQDDRLHWPLRFFTDICQCKGNYGGIGCGKCRFGYTGPTCGTPLPKRVRQSVWKMSVEEQRRYMDILNAAKYTPSNMSVLNVDGSETADPITREKLSFKEVSIFDYMVYYHYYASRTTMFDGGLDRCSINDHRLDFAHKGPGFFPWHRQYLLLFEEVLAHVALTQFGQTDFSLPYWDWTNQTDCLICTNDLVGDFYNPTIPASLPRSADVIKQLRDNTNTTISPQSIFSDWEIFCQHNTSYTDPCFYCNLNATEKHYLTRTYNERPGYDRFASQDEMDYVISSKIYDVEPYNANAPNTSFRNNLEGFSTILGRGSAMNTHSMGHNFFAGVFRDRASSPNDPIFIFHHVYIDKVFDIWLQATPDSGKVYPNTSNLPFGHHPNDFMVPSFPPVQAIDYFVLAEELGYGYDDHRVGTSIFEPLNFVPANSIVAAPLPALQMNTPSTIIVAAAALICVAVFAYVIYGLGKMWHQKRRLYQQVSLPELEENTSLKKRFMLWRLGTMKQDKDESTPLL
jgi:hypothetical protein